MGGSKSKRKGYEGERELVNLIPGSRRVPLSGALAHMGEELANDVVLPDGTKVEVKRRASGFKTLYDWVLDQREKPDIVAVRTDRMPWLVVMTLDKYMEMKGLQKPPKKEK